MVMHLDLHNPRRHEVVDAAHFHNWLHVFACPRIFHEMARKPPREHILRLFERYRPYASSKREYADQQGYYCFKADEQRREELAERLRELLENWTPPILPMEITEIARALLDAEGIDQPAGGWDNL